MDVATYRIDRVPSSLEIGTSNLDRGSSSSLDEDYTFSSTRFGTMLYSLLFKYYTFSSTRFGTMLYSPLFKYYTSSSSTRFGTNWNNLPSYVRQIHKLETFKKELKSWVKVNVPI